jgi:hypothetical protein
MLLTHQRRQMDCVIATLSMYLRIEYEKVHGIFMQQIGRSLDEYGILDKEMELIAKTLGTPIKARIGKPKEKAILTVKFVEKDREHPIHCGNSAWYHAVYYDGYSVFDPAMHGSIATCLTTEHYLAKAIYYHAERKWF